MKFKSKIDLWFHLVVVLFTILTFQIVVLIMSSGDTEPEKDYILLI